MSLAMNRRIILMLTGVVFLLMFSNVCLAHKWKAPEKAVKMVNPIAIDDQSLTLGKNSYAQNCADCHGIDAKGMSAESAGLDKSPSNLPKRLKTHSDGDFFWKIQHGKGDMPSFKESLDDKEIWSIINHIKSLIK